MDVDSKWMVIHKIRQQWNMIYGLEIRRDEVKNDVRQILSNRRSFIDGVEMT